MQKLVEELDYLWRKQRPEVTRALSAAAAEGDRSENAEYIYRKKQLREIDSRVRHLRKRLDGMRVVEHLPENTERVYFGAWVSLLDIHHHESVYRIVGPDEFDAKRGYISMDSPMGKALLGKSLHDEIEMQLTTQAGTCSHCFTIIDIHYTLPAQ